MSRVLTVDLATPIITLVAKVDRSKEHHVYVTRIRKQAGEWVLDFDADSKSIFSGLSKEASTGAHPRQTQAPLRGTPEDAIDTVFDIVDTSTLGLRSFVGDAATFVGNTTGHHDADTLLLGFWSVADQILPTGEDSLVGCMLCNVGKIAIVGMAAGCVWMTTTGAGAAAAAQCTAAATTFWLANDEFCDRIKCDGPDWSCSDSIQLIGGDPPVDFEIRAETFCSDDVTIGMSPIYLAITNSPQGKVFVTTLPPNMCPVTNYCSNSWSALRIAPGTCWQASFKSVSWTAKQWETRRNWVDSNVFCTPLPPDRHL